MEFDNFIIQSTLGQGAFGLVYQAESKITKEKYALKVLEI